MNIKSISRTEQDIDRCLPSNLSNEVRPAFGKWPISKRYPMPTCAKNAEIVMPSYLERGVEHIGCRRGQFDINVEPAVLDRASHNNLRFVGRD